ncbi:cytoplasmic dynein 2 intermediate chain 1 [Diachasmimorpha longicaudata]|uniref:cytoplasmic dynein 2 intermediate chain 1 n=1 Tax=Diachasmimorpha longicaudata TaxID=58733 RepID=UPI0030B8C5A6
MSTNSSGQKKKPVTRDKSQVRQGVRVSSKDKQEVETKNNVPIKRSSTKIQGDRVPGRITTSTRSLVSGRPPQELTASSTRKILKKQSSDPEKRGVSSIYMPRKSSTDEKKPTLTPKPTGRTKNRERLPSKERRKSRTLSPSEVKVLNKRFPKSDSSPDYNYEDDFEDYESDFQDCTETDASEVSDESQGSDEPDLEPIELKSKEPVKQLKSKEVREHEEHMLDSGHYELEEARRRAARMDLMSSRHRVTGDSHRAMVFGEDKPSEIRSLPSSADEGFEDGRSGDFAKSPPLGGHEIVGLREIKRFNEVGKKLSRGRKLLQMIKLDVVEWSVFETTPIAYEEFIRIHGRINTRQIATQTREDDLSVETQTEEIRYRNVWTQFPVVCRSSLKTSGDIEGFNREMVGVGSDENDHQVKRPVYDVLKLNEFLGAAGRVVLALLEEERVKKSEPQGPQGQDMPFSESSIKLAISTVTFLTGRPVVIVKYPDTNSRIILSIHAPADDDNQDIETSADDGFYMTDCCIGCLWNVHEPFRPIKLFYSGSCVTAVCLHPGNWNLVFAGLDDGSVSLWDLEEDEAYHPKFVDKDNEAEWVLRSPTFSTVGTFDGNDDEGLARVVAIKVLSKIETDGADNSVKFMPIQICSLNEDGNCTVWSVLRNLDTGASLITQQLGQSWWGKIRLVKSHKIALSRDKNNVDDSCMTAFRDFSVDPLDTDNLYIASNTSKLLHATRTGKKLKPSFYGGNFMNNSGTTCIEPCPFGQPYFLVGFSDGTLRLYSSTIEKPLVQLKNSNSTAPIKIIQWSRSKPFTIYVLDDKSNIHIWDLSRSDILPLYSISSRKSSHIGSMELSPCKNDSDLVNQYLALGLDNGALEIHRFTKEFHYSNTADRTADLNTFLYYVTVY